MVAQQAIIIFENILLLTLLCLFFRVWAHRNRSFQSMKIPLICLGICLFGGSLAWAAPESETAAWNFTCDLAQHKQNLLLLSDSTRFTAESAAGFDLGTTAKNMHKSCESDQPFFVSVHAPEGIYQVTVTFGSDDHDSITTVKAESRRLMLEAIKAPAHHSVTETFTVQVRTKDIATGGEVHLKPREIGALDWDDKLTLEFSALSPFAKSITFLLFILPATPRLSIRIRSPGRPGDRCCRASSIRMW